LNALFVALENLNSLLLCASDIGLLPATGTAAIAMLNEQMAAADLTLALASGVRASSSRGVVLRHVDFEFFGIGFRRWLPARLFCRRVEVVWEILRVGMANFPTGRKTCVSLGPRVSYANF
jgi:hypothetical protein